MLGWEGSSDIHSLKSPLSHIKDGSSKNTENFSRGENSAQPPQLAAHSTSEFGLYQPGPYPKERSTEDLPLPALGSIPNWAGRALDQPGRG